MFYALVWITLVFSYVRCQQICQCSQLDSCVQDREQKRTQQMSSCRDNCKSNLVKGQNTADCYELRDNQANMAKQELKSCMANSGVRPCTSNRFRRQSLGGSNFADLLMGIFNGNGIDWDSLAGGSGLWSPGGGGGGGPGGMFGGLSNFLPFLSGFGGGSGGGSPFGGGGGFGQGGDGSNNWGPSSGSQGGSSSSSSGWSRNQGGGNSGSSGWSGNQGGGNNGGWSPSGGSSGQSERGSGLSRLGITLSGDAKTELDKYEDCVRDCMRQNSQSDTRRPRDNSGGGGGRGGGIYATCAQQSNCQLNTQGGNRANAQNCNKSGFKSLIPSFCSCLQQVYGNSNVNCDNAGQINKGSSGANSGGNNNGGSWGNSNSNQGQSRSSGFGGQGNRVNQGSGGFNGNSGQGNSGGWADPQRNPPWWRGG